MKLAVLVATASLAVAASVAAAASPTTHMASAAPPCIPKFGTSGGHLTVDYCGPATATLKIASKTYSFKDGYCSKSASFKLQLTLGVISSDKSPLNDGQPLFQLQDLDAAGLQLTTVSADYQGKTLETVGSVTFKGSLTDATFTAKSPSGGRFSGSWNCHSGIYSTS